MPNIFSKIVSAIVGWFTSGKAKRDAETALKYAAEALPFLKVAADIVVGLTPTQIDDLAWAALKTKYPKLFDGSIHTDAELKGYALQVAAALLREKYPKLDTTVSVLAAQLAYVQARGEGVAPSIIPAPSAPSPLSL